MVKESHLVGYGVHKKTTDYLKFQGWVSELPVCSESTYEPKKTTDKQTRKSASL